MEYEVCVNAFTSNNKTQQLSMEKSGKITREQPTKLQLDQNIWIIATASDPSLSEPIKEIAKYTAEDLLNDIKAKLLARGNKTIRGLGRIFRHID